MMCTLVVVGIMMIVITLMNDEGHCDNVSGESDDNDDVLTIVISSLLSVMKTVIFFRFRLHMNVFDGVCDNSRFD